MPEVKVSRLDDLIQAVRKIMSIREYDDVDIEVQTPREESCQTAGRSVMRAIRRKPPSHYANYKNTDMTVSADNTEELRYTPSSRSICPVIPPWGRFKTVLPLKQKRRLLIHGLDNGLLAEMLENGIPKEAVRKSNRLERMNPRAQIGYIVAY
jgi:hypothetical protein